MWTRILIFLFFAASGFSEQADILFVLHNAGETNDLLPVISKALEENFNVRVLAIGVAEELIKGKIPENITQTLKDVEVKTPITKFSPRTQQLQEQEVETIADLLPAKKLVTGVPSLIEGQLLKAYRNRLSTTFAYWDNFSSDSPDPYFATAHKVQRLAHYLLLPSQKTAKAPEFESRPAAEKLVVGKPSLEEWMQTIKAINVSKCRYEVGIDPTSPQVAVWIGGYGPDHKKAFELFVHLLKNLKPKQRPTKLIIQQHPNANKAELDPYTYFQFAERLLLPESTILSTIQAIAISDIVISYNSTAALQALLAGKKVLFIVPPNDCYSNIAIDQGLAPKISTLEQFYEAFNVPHRSMNVWKQLGIPEEDSINLFLQTLKEH